MANLATVLKLEITRIARRELRAETESLKKAAAHYRSEITALKRKVAELERHLRESGVTVPVTSCANIAEACDRAYQMAGDGDRILAFGSFLTVAAAMIAVRARR